MTLLLAALLAADLPNPEYDLVSGFKPGAWVKMKLTSNTGTLVVTDWKNGE